MKALAVPVQHWRESEIFKSVKTGDTHGIDDLQLFVGIIEYLWTVNRPMALMNGMLMPAAVDPGFMRKH